MRVMARRPYAGRAEKERPRRARDGARSSIAGERARGLGFEVHVRVLAHVDRHTEDRAALERAGRLVILADVVAAVAPDAEAVAGERELAHLRLHRAIGDLLVVDV